MLNEFRVDCCYGNWLNARFLSDVFVFPEWQYSKCQNCYAVTPCSFHMELPIHRELNQGGNESLSGHSLWFLVSALTASTQTELGNLLVVGCQAKVKNSDMHHHSAEPLKAEVSQSYFYFWYDSVSLCQFRGTLCQCCNVPYTCAANHSDTGSHSHFLASLLPFIFHFYPPSLSLMLRKCCIDKYTKYSCKFECWQVKIRRYVSHNLKWSA